MICHFCQHEAVGKCVSCGLAFCSDHGKRYCHVCSSAVFSREAVTGQRDEPGYLQCPPRPEMPTIYLEDDGPPECYRCLALARKVCQNCHSLYCLEHAGTGGFCDQCAKAAKVGNWVTIAIVGVMAALAALFYLLSHFEAIR
jgi:hypothetical protein